jgi:hypothetical protein
VSLLKFVQEKSYELSAECLPDPDLSLHALQPLCSEDCPQFILQLKFGQILNLKVWSSYLFGSDTNILQLTEQ